MPKFQFIIVVFLDSSTPQIQYEQRCSQLVGLALCTMNFTGKYPEYIRLRGTSYAIRPLGDTYLMVGVYLFLKVYYMYFIIHECVDE